MLTALMCEQVVVEGQEQWSVFMLTMYSSPDVLRTANVWKWIWFTPPALWMAFAFSRVCIVTGTNLLWPRSGGTAILAGAVCLTTLILPSLLPMSMCYGKMRVLNQANERAAHEAKGSGTVVVSV
jgi:hypothetical protein